jgi:hypothetical protein
MSKRDVVVKIVENHDRKSVTVVFGGVVFYSAKYLLELWEGERYFGNGILRMDTTQLKEVLLGISRALNSVNPGVNVKASLLYEGGADYPLIRNHINADGDWDGTYDLALSVFTKGKERALFFEDLARTRPVKNEDIIKEHEWGVELELKASIDEESLDVNIFTVLHRIIKGKKTERNYRSNDDAWDGFDFGENDDEDFVIDTTEDDLPF